MLTLAPRIGSARQVGTCSPARWMTWVMSKPSTARRRECRSVTSPATHVTSAGRGPVHWRRSTLPRVVSTMELLFHYETPPGPCEYLAGQTWRYEHDIVASLTAAEYQERLHRGWRRFGHLLFRPRCPNCTAC